MNYYFAVYECDENGNELDHLKNFKGKEKAIAYCDKLDFNSHVVIMPPSGFDEGNSEDMEEWDSDYEPYEVIYDNFEKVRNNSKKRRGNTPYTNYMHDIFPNEDNEEEWEKWRRDYVNFFNKWQDTCIENHVRVYDLIDYLVNAIYEILNINKQDRRGLWDIDACCFYLMFGPDINSAAYKKLLNAHSTNDIDNVIKKYGKTAEDYNGLLSIKNSVIKSSINFSKNDFEEFRDDLYDAILNVFRKHDTATEEDMDRVIRWMKDHDFFGYDDSSEEVFPEHYNELQKELKDKMFDIALQYQSEWSEDSDPEVRSWAEDDTEAIAEMLYEDADNDTRNDWFSDVIL